MPGGGSTYKRIFCSCLKCKNQISTNNLNLHFGSKECLMGFKASASHATIIPTPDLKCIHCTKQCKSENSYRQHIIRCSKNSNAIKIKNNIGERTKGKSPWNKGLTKQTNASLADQAKRLSEIGKSKSKHGKLSGPFTATYWTADKRKEKSDWRKKLHTEFPESHPNRKLAGNRKKMTYPEKIAFEFLTKNNVIFEHQKKILNYYVDFCINQVIIEIDGERWHPIGNSKDAERDRALAEIGYKVYRIRSKESIESKIEEILSL